MNTKDANIKDTRESEKLHRTYIPGMILLHDPADLDDYVDAVVAFGEGRIRRQELMAKLLAFGVSTEDIRWHVANRGRLRPAG
jgi:hypothetical protein